MHQKKQPVKRLRDSPSPISKKTSRRGRPPVEWTVSRQRRLLRLYLNTPESSLSLEHILLLLREGSFNPKKRKTQDLLQNLLSKAYHERRPRDSTQMRSRLQYLRSHLKARGTLDRSTDKQSTDVLADANSTPVSWTRLKTSLTTSIQGIPSCKIPTISLAKGEEATDLNHDQSSQTANHHNDSTILAASSQQLTLSKEAKTMAHVHRDRTSWVRSLLPGPHRSSFLADVASLFSGLSLRSSSCSSAAESWRFSSPSHSPRTRNSVKSEGLPSRFFREKIGPLPEIQIPLLPDVQEDPFFHQRSTADHSVLATFCCSRPYQDSPCIHKHLSHVIKHGLPNADQGGPFIMPEAQVNMRDPMGNCLIHHAARWGASMDLLFGIAEQTSFTRPTNYRSETFLHLLAPSTGSLLRANELQCFTKMIDLIKARLFNFCVIDDTGRSVLRRLLLNREFPWKAILILLERVGSEVIRSWTFGDQSGHLAKDVQARLRLDGGQSLALALHAQYLIDDHSVSFAHRQHFRPGNLMCRTYPAVRGGNVLHRVIAMLNTKNKWIITRCPWVPWHRCEDDNAHEPLNFAVGLKAIIETPGYQECVNEEESCTDMTPLMALLVEFGCGSLQDDELQADCVSVLLDHGASLDLCDSIGNTPVHYAAALGLTPALKVLLKSHASLKWENNFGLTPKDVAISSLMSEKASNNPRGVKVVARLYEAIAILSELSGPSPIII